MGKRRGRGKLGKQLGRVHAERAAQGRVIDDGGATKVLTMEGEDVPLDPNATIDLVTAGKNFVDGAPKFHVRSPDPMRAFTKRAPQFPMLQPGPDGKVTIPISEDVRRRLDTIKRPNETDEDAINRILDVQRRPTYPQFSSEYDLGVEISSIIQGQHLDRGQADRLLKKLENMSHVSRFSFLKRHLIDTIGTNDGTDLWGRRLGSLMAFVRHTLTPSEADRLVKEVVAERTPIKSTGGYIRGAMAAGEWFASTEEQRAIIEGTVALHVAKEMAGMSPDMRAKMYAEIRDGIFPVTEGAPNSPMQKEFLAKVWNKMPPFISDESPDLSEALKHLAPHRKERAKAALSMFDRKTAADIIHPLLNEESIELEQSFEKKLPLREIFGAT